MEKFIDHVKIYVKSGSGGNGCRSFYRDKYTRDGIPDGGKGGRGADIIVRADRNLLTLLDLQFNKHFYGKHGGHGSGKYQKGRDAVPVVIRVPCGVSILDVGTRCLLGHLDHDGQELIVAKGGKGGLGNNRHQDATPGDPGEEKELFFDLKLLADVGIIGFPNAGKSTLLSRISNAKPLIAAYPFSTTFPVLGVVNATHGSFVIADIPGLIEGSSQGKGLGDSFLRHIERTRILVHVIDMGASELRDPVRDYRIIMDEIKAYSAVVCKKPQIIVANKMDLEPSNENLKRFRRIIKKKVYPISALQNDGLARLTEAIEKKLSAVRLKAG